MRLPFLVRPSWSDRQHAACRRMLGGPGAPAAQAAGLGFLLSIVLAGCPSAGSLDGSLDDWGDDDDSASGDDDDSASGDDDDSAAGDDDDSAAGDDDDSASGDDDDDSAFGDDDDSASGDDDDSASDDDDSADDDDAQDDDDSTPSGQWRSSLYPTDWTPAWTDPGGHFLHDFSYAGYRNSEASIPSPAVVASVVDHGADASGATDSCPAIQAAIDAASALGGGAVLLPAGEYRCEDVLRVTSDAVVLRGEGAGATHLYFTRTAGMTGSGHIEFRGDLQGTASIPLVQDGESRSVVVKVSDASSLSVGDEVSLGWDISPDFVADHGMTGVWGLIGAWKPFFRREVVAVDTSSTPNEVELDVPLRYPALVRDNASLRPESGYLSECGIEEMSLSTVGDWNDAWGLARTHAVVFSEVSDCWMQQIETYESPNSSDSRARHLLSGGVKVVHSKRVTVRDSTLEFPQNRGPNGNGYLFEISRSSEVLIADSTARAGRHNFVQNWDFGTSGCVFLRTDSRDGRSFSSQNLPFSLPAYSEFHHSLAMANLIDESSANDGWSAVNRNDYSSGAGHSATENVFWNLRGGGLIRSFQYKTGYVIGTQGMSLQTTVGAPLLFGADLGTQPDDWVEGQHAGDLLYPPSLFDDQLARRLAAP